MKADELWKIFAETGEPVFYLLYRAVREESRSLTTEDTVAVIANQ